jgi:hypothetical protein
VAKPKAAAKPKATPKPAAPTSGVIPGFTPTVAMPTPAVQPGQVGFVGPVAPTKSSQSGILLDTYDPNTGLMTSWSKAGTVITLQGPVDVNINGRAKDGSIPVSVDSNTGNNTGGGATSFSAAQDKILSDTLASYGMQGMAAVIAKIRAENPEISSEDLTFLLKNDTRYNSEYLKRFAGNAKLKAAGLPTMADDEYLKAEKEYEKIFLAYGAKSLANRDYYATLIGNRMDAPDVTERLNLAYDRLQATPEVKEAFKTFYKAVTEGDILAAMLDPTTQITQLDKKIKAAEIGGAALQQKLSTSLATAAELVGMGVTTAQAQAGYSTIAQALPTAEGIYERYTGQNITKEETQAKLEASRLKKNAQAIREEQMAVGQEINLFGGSSGRLASKNRAQGLI